jgi:hypothetical protein
MDGRALRANSGSRVWMKGVAGLGMAEILYCCIGNELWGKLGREPLQSVGSLLSMLGADFEQGRGGIPIPRCPAQSRRQNSGGAPWSQIR